MALTAEQITALNFHDYHQMILPYLNGGGMGMKLLWENPNPTSSFSEQDVTLSSSDYDVLLILQTTANRIHGDIAVKGNNGILMHGVGTFRYRLFSYVSDTKLHFEDGKYNTSYNGSLTTDNTYCIPYRIYGIKVYNRDVQSDYEIIDGTIDSIGANAKKTITLSPTIPTGKKVIGWSMYAVDSDLQTYMQYYGGNYILCVKNIGNNAMTNKDYRVVFIYGQ